MTTPTSGQISIYDIANEFGGAAPHGLFEYYKGGAYVSNAISANNPNIPVSGPISLYNFYGTTKPTNITWDASTSWVCPPGIYQIYVRCWGGGGGGSNGWYIRGLGGNAGADSGWVLVNVTPGVTYSVNVGTGGLGTTYRGYQLAGANGGSSSFNGVSAAGGTGGQYEYYHGGWGTAGQSSSIGTGGAPNPPNNVGGDAVANGGPAAGGGGGFGSPASGGGNGGNGRIQIYW